MDPYIFNQLVNEYNMGRMLVDAWRVSGWIAGVCTLIGIGLDVLRRVKETRKNGQEVHTVKVSVRSMPYLFAIMWGFIFVYFTWWITRR
jgi:hypothetical protein